MPDASWSEVCSKRNSWRDMRKPFRCPITIQKGHHSRILLAIHTSRHKSTCPTLRQVPTIRQSAPFPLGRTNTYIIAFAIRAIGSRHHGTFPYWKTSIKICSSCHWLLHQMGRSRTLGYDNRKEHTKFRLEDSNMLVRHSTSPRIRQW